MERGDLSNQSEPRVLFVFDDLVATLPKDGSERGYYLNLKFHRYKTAAKMWEFDPYIVARMNEVWWRKGYRYDLVTFQPEEMEEPIRKEVDKLSIPYSNFWSTTPDKLSRQIAMMPDVIMVYDANPTHMFTYGGKGRTIIDPREI